MWDNIFGQSKEYTNVVSQEVSRNIGLGVCPQISDGNTRTWGGLRQ